ncbi:Alpha/Beta hydrolase protein [Gamsiella multidivaricata]|uniref:Alpha/Beta hydrolase protein n=1 Tax=Gamsiella multidivaricata TaxID=101098 RepID=UPI002220B27B|nr:Alpha/Beta hydrolase protein [Gamsiella multidivaricata]KAG0354520.1 hypothetical protein BGZ54_001601 [Gamsiella multidivaricata]KAI7822891.1 Alpha/Beta hydrolase protein [Gamsiella multidivaricata]
MQRTHSSGIPFLRRQSTAPPPVPYANPAATQFLRLGVGIDHVDVDHSDEEDVIYQGIENGMDGHHTDDQLETETDTENEDDDIEVEEEDFNTFLQQQLHQLDKEGDDIYDDSIRSNGDNNLSGDINNNSSNSSSQQMQPMVAQGHDMPSSSATLAAAVPASVPAGTAATTAVAPSSDTDTDTGISAGTVASLSTQGSTIPGAPTNTSSSAIVSPSARRIPASINTQFTPRETLSADLKKPLSPKPQRQGPTSPISPLAQDLPDYHEKFTKQTKLHGASPLSNANNTVTASSVAPTATKPSTSRRNTAAVSTETKPSAPRRTTTTASSRQPTETDLTPGTENSSSVPTIKRYAEKDGLVTVHDWKVHYKICYPTIDPSYRVNGNGRNIILFHGALSTLDTWRKVQQTLADRTGCRVLAYDRIGHGLSDKPTTWPKDANPYKNGGVLSICHALLETLGMNQNLVLIGNGTGGTIASALALSKPNLVRGLILVAPAILDEAPPLYLRACVSYPPPLTWIYRGLYGNHGPLQQFYHKPKPMMADPQTIEMYTKPAKEEGFWRGLANATRFRASYKVDKHLDLLTEISTLVMTGDVDDIVPTMETLRLFETLQSARQLNVPQVLKIIKHAGHLPQEEKPTDFIKVVSFFIRKVCLGSLPRERSFGRRSSGGVVRSVSKRSVNSNQNAQSVTGANTQANVSIPPVPPIPAIMASPQAPSPSTGSEPQEQQMAAPGPMVRSPSKMPIKQATALPAVQQPIKSY